MAILTLDLAGPLAINQGYEWRASILYPGNAIGARLIGKIYDRFNGIELVTFQAGQARFDGTLNRTQLELLLPSRVTQALPLTGSGYWVYNVRLTVAARQPQLLLAGKVKILPTLPL